MKTDLNNVKANLAKGIMKLETSLKARFSLRAIATLFIAGIVAASYTGTVFASGEANIDGVVSPIVELINSFVTALLALVSAGGTIFVIMLGVKFATAEEPQEKEKRKQALKTAIIGFVFIFVIIVALKLSIGPITDLMYNSLGSQNGSTPSTNQP